MMTEEQYNIMQSTMPTSVDFSLLSQYELEDGTTNARALACTAGGCEVS